MIGMMWGLADRVHFLALYKLLNNMKEYCRDIGPSVYNQELALSIK